MLTIGSGMTPAFLGFIEQLNNKKEGQPFIIWREGWDFLIVLIGDGDCRRYMLGGWPALFVDFLVKRNPKEKEDPFAGFGISGGIQGLLRKQYAEAHGDRYEEFRIRHNERCQTYHASELFEKWLERFPATDFERVERIRRALRRQDPSIHIPL